MLESKNIKFEIFELPPEKLGAQESAELMGVPAEKVFKTIVTRREQTGKIVLAVIPGNMQADLKMLAKLLNEKKMQVTT